jgi:dTDP-4-amino-4,6-dideoxygalactose transaminase
VHFVAIHLHDYYRRRLGYAAEDLPAATYVSTRTVSLPLSAYLTDDDVDNVIDATHAALARC